MSGVIRVDHREGDLFAISVRHHTLLADQPLEEGGSDAGPTPTELLVVSLASCVAFYARRFLARHDLRSDGLSVLASFAMAARPARVSDIQVSITVPDGVPEDMHERLLAVASHCTVHNTFETPPRVTVSLKQADREPALS